MNGDRTEAQGAKATTSKNPGRTPFAVRPVRRTDGDRRCKCAEPATFVLSGLDRRGSSIYSMVKFPDGFPLPTLATCDLHLTDDVQSIVNVMDGIE